MMEKAPVMVEITCQMDRCPDDPTGFPFDDSDFEDRDRSFRSHIDDIVQRHPELAEHLNFDNKFSRKFPSFDEWGNRSGSSRIPSGRPSGSRFRDRFSTSPREHDFAETFRPTFAHEEAAAAPQQRQQTTAANEEEQPHVTPTAAASRTDNKPPHAPPKQQQQYQQQTHRPPQQQKIQQSNTVDLGQKQEPVEDARGQRSMSAPPENKRFVSSINIPNFGAPESPSTMPQQHAPPQHQQQQASAPQNQQQGKPTERVIPIHVEGRDAPVMPSADNFATTGQTHQQQPPPQQQQHQGPPRGFGQRPNFYSKFNKPDPPSGFFTGDPYATQRSASPQQGFHQGFRSEQAPSSAAPPQQQQVPPPAPQPQAAPQAPQQPPPPPKPQGPLSQIQCIQKDVLDLMTEVERFNGKPRDKQYLYLDEMLTRNLLKLDDIETEGKDEIRQARKEAINCIQKCISILEAKALANEQLRNQLMQQVSNPKTALEVSGVKRSGSEASNNGETIATGGSMDVDQAKGEEKSDAAPENIEEKTQTKEVVAQSATAASDAQEMDTNGSGEGAPSQATTDKSDVNTATENGGASGSNNTDKKENSAAASK